MSKTLSVILWIVRRKSCTSSASVYLLSNHLELVQFLQLRLYFLCVDMINYQFLDWSEVVQIQKKKKSVVQGDGL